MGSIMTLAALARLKGVTAFFKSIMAADRKVQSSLYLISLGESCDFTLTLVLSICSAVIWKSDVWTVVCSLFQVGLEGKCHVDGDVGSVRDGIVPRRCSHNPG